MRGRLALRGCSAAAEIHGSGVATANQDSDALAGLGLITAREQRGQGRGASRFSHNAKNLPERFLSLLNRCIGHEQHALYMSLCDGEHQFADTFRSQRVGELMFPIAQTHVQSMLLVSDAAIQQAQEALWKVLRIVAEPGGAAALAA